MLGLIALILLASAAALIGGGVWSTIGYGWGPTEAIMIGIGAVCLIVSVCLLKGLAGPVWTV